MATAKYNNIEAMYQKYAKPKIAVPTWVPIPMTNQERNHKARRIGLQTPYEALSATVERRALVRVLQAEAAFLEALCRADEATQARYDAVHAALDAAGATLANPGALAKRIGKTLELNDALAHLLRLELLYLKEVQTCEART